MVDKTRKVSLSKLGKNKSGTRYIARVEGQVTTTIRVVKSPIIGDWTASIRGKFSPIRFRGKSESEALKKAKVFLSTESDKTLDTQLGRGFFV